MNNSEYWEKNDKYHDRQGEVGSVTANIVMFGEILPLMDDARSIIELGSGEGRNIEAIHKLKPSLRTTAVEINPTAAEKNTADEIIVCDVLDLDPFQTADIVLTKGFLIHIHPDRIEEMYDRIYLASNKYILLCEYYNPTLMGISYQGRPDLLWKRDFAGEMLDMYKDLRLVSYGFHYHRHEFPQDDITWFLLEKK